MLATARTLWKRWRARSNAKHRSGWDNPTTGADLLAAMIQTNRRRKDPLP
jgi:hypothetical protein